MKVRWPTVTSRVRVTMQPAPQPYRFSFACPTGSALHALQGPDKLGLGFRVKVGVGVGVRVRVRVRVRASQLTAYCL